MERHAHRAVQRPSTDRFAITTLTLVILWFAFLDANPFLPVHQWSEAIEKLSTGAFILSAEHIAGRVMLTMLFAALVRRLVTNSRLSWFVVVVFCLVVEVCQSLFLGRHPRMGDFLVAICSGRLAWSLTPGALQLLKRRALERRAKVYLSRAFLVVLSTIWLWSVAISSTQMSLSSWDPSYPLLVGDEASGARPWAGCVHYLAIYLGSYGHRDSEPYVAFGGPNATACLLPGEPLTDPVTTRRLVSAIVKRGAFTVETVLEGFAEFQSGPARIATLSEDLYHRDFTVGQENQQLIFRVRNFRNGENGARLVPVWDRVFAEQRRLDLLLSYGPDGYLMESEKSEPRPPDRWFVEGVSPMRNLAASQAWMSLLLLIPVGLYFEVGCNARRSTSVRVIAGAAATCAMLFAEFLATGFSTQISGILALQSGVIIATAAYLADRLGLSA